MLVYDQIRDGRFKLTRKTKAIREVESSRG